ncbi:MAG TPA: glycine C-acetyltransferase [Candidatus Limnocylindrales bacterium]|jgi:glycine C-acetyltransferase
MTARGTNPDPLGFLADELEELKRQNLYRPMRVLSSPQAAEVVVDGAELISLSSNNYLGLATHPKLKEAAIAATRDFGAGSGAVRTIAGNMTIHEQLETELAEFKHVEAVLTFQSGFTANTGVIPVVTGESDLIVSDALNHASIIDGMRMSKAPRVIFPHKDIAALRGLLREAREKGRADAGGQPYRLILVVTDGVFSMDGDIAPLPEIVAAAEDYGAAVMVDDAHASGVLGRNGRGTVDRFDLHGRVHIQVGTLSKAIGVLGGYVAGSQALRDMLIQRARPFLFSTSHPPAVAAACLAAIHVLEEQPELIDRLWANTVYFKGGLRGLGFDTGASETPITPVMMRDAATALRFSQRLFEEGIFAQAVVFPTVALDKARIRTIVTAEHSTEQLDRCLEAFGKVGRELGLISA